MEVRVCDYRMDNVAGVCVVHIVLLAMNRRRCCCCCCGVGCYGYSYRTGDLLMAYEQKGWHYGCARIHRGRAIRAMSALSLYHRIAKEFSLQSIILSGALSLPYIIY